jgi:hypothetical protein
MSLTDIELGLLRQEAEVWQSDVCDIYRMTVTEDNYGGHGESAEVVIASGVSCSVDPGAAHAQTITMLGLQRPDTLFIIYLPADQDVKVGDHIIVTSKSNMHVRVQALMAPQTDEVERMVITSNLAEHNP